MADDPLPLLLIAGARIAGQPGVLASELDPLVRRLTRLDPDVDSDGHAQRTLTTLLPHLWAAGWQPADVVHVVRRRTSQRGARLIGAVLRADALASGAADRAPAAWVAQLDAVPTSATSVADWWRGERVDAADAWRDVLRVIGQVRTLPSLEMLLPPPAAWSVGLRVDLDAVTGADPKLLGRIRALLAKAESTDFEEEADALTAKAQSLMARHAIDAAVLAQRPGAAARSSVTARRLHLEDPHVDAKAAMVQAVGSANGVRVVLVPALGMATLVGLADDLDVVELLVTSLLLQANRAMTAATRGGGSRTRSTAYRRGFLYAFAQRIGERLAEARDQATADATAAYGSALLPVLAERERAVERAVGELFPRLAQRAGRVVDATGWHAGRLAADDADLGTGHRPLPAGRG
ncbi:Protein of unknown function [Modestobacter sp. DSM 44400]|uniref:DUF2786 domain-containing protein n=1 Tax=Modestobacter sp. DSM 44400 TaxID=1550230 RepID=UPI00089D272F|nr:DUF2786 domain-containing protein [Modestobacter sp. DSM 44400]SDY52948.1 Protein of unknown function [Modestobacter sp. DSM 44400]